MASTTVIIPVSPIPSHPDPVVLRMTLDSIRERLPDSLIMLMFDGLSVDNENRRTDYEEFISRMLWAGEHEYGNVLPLVFQAHSHQSVMTKEALHLVETSTILWSEQDTPLVNDIPFDDLIPVIETGYANVIRFSHEALILPDHQFLMLDAAPIDILGQPFVRTYQWSGRPHLASTKYYRHLAAQWDDAPRFIEHILYGPISEGPYDENRVHIYAPEPPYPNGTIVSSLHTDGRRYGAEEYDPSVSAS